MTPRTSSSTRLFAATLVVVLVAQVLDAASSTPARDLSLFSGMRYRLVGPFVGGRASAVAGVPGNPHVYYFGTAAGGVWKTADAGLTWDPIFDDQPIASIGHIAVAESDPRVVYVGTGESCFRADVSHGNGVYKSVDAGETWQHLGLEATRHIGRIAIHPQNPDVVFVAALGQAHGAEGNPDRGVFRSTDGGQSWEKVLYVNEKTGAVDLSLDRNRPNVVFAATWEVYRLPWEFSSGGPGSGLYRSTDGGSSWERLSQGLPDGIMGKIAVEVSPADSNRVYALIEASEEEKGLYRSDDGGNTWQRVSRDPELVQRPWYFLHLIADSKDPDVLYVPSLKLNRSMDGGHTWTQMRLANSSENIRRQYRPDSHDMWIAPENPSRMANANDAGVNITMNGGKTWTRSDNNRYFASSAP